jgi:hypothetical protein
MSPLSISPQGEKLFTLDDLLYETEGFIINISGIF